MKERREHTDLGVLTVRTLQLQRVGGGYDIVPRTAALLLLDYHRHGKAVRLLA